jgi:hypothetical protein
MKEWIKVGMVLAMILGWPVTGITQDFSTSDLEGSWYFYSTEVDSSVPAVYWLMGNVEVDAAGNMAGVYTAPDGSSVALTSGQMTVARDGTIKGSYSAETGLTGTVVDGKLDRSKTFGNVVMIGSDGTMDLATMIKGGGTFAPADIQGQWYSYATIIDTVSGGVFWMYGTIDVDSSGNVTGSYLAANGMTATVTEGSFLLDDSGVIDGSMTLSIGERSLTPPIQGKLDPGKTFASWVGVSEDQSMAVGYFHKAGGTFTPGEGKGFWYAYGLSIDPTVPAVYWAYGRSVFDASDDLKGVLIAPTGEQLRATSESVLDENGVYTGTLAFSNGDTGMTASAKLDQNRTSLTGVTVNNSGSMGVWRFIKGSPALYFPHVASGGVWETEIGMINDTESETITGDLVAYSDLGAEVSRTEVSLAPRGRRAIIVGDEFTDPGQIGYLVFQPDGDHLCKGYTKFYRNGMYRVAVPAVAELNMDTIYISHIASGPEWWTGVSLLNTSADAREITMEFNTGDTVTKTLAAFEHTDFTIRSLFGGTAPAGVASAVIRNADGIIGLELFGSTETSGSSYLSGILLTDDTAQDIYYPHVVSGVNWWTGIAAYNPADTTTNLEITTYDAAGSILETTDLSLSAREKFIGTAESLGFPAAAAWFHIHADAPVTGFELFGTTNGQQLGGYAGVGIQRTEGVFAKVENDGWTGIAFVNTENESATVAITAYDDGGTAVASESLALGAYEKVIGLAPELFTDDITGATYIHFSSSGNVVGFQLNGSSDDMMLDGLPGM